MNGSIRCRFPDLAPVVGYAATAGIRATSRNESEQLEPSQLWSRVIALHGALATVVVEDLDDPSRGSAPSRGEVNANVFRALGSWGW